ERRELVSLQGAAAVGLGEPDRFTRGRLAPCVVPQPLEDLPKEHVGWHELPDAGAQLLLDLDLPLGVRLRLEEFLFAKREVRIHVLDGRSRFAHQLVLLGQDVMLALQSGAGLRELALPDSHQCETDQYLLQLDLVVTRKALADAQRPLPGPLRLRIAAFPLIDPGIRNMD